ncbi:uncharacterized protein [Nicotiana sylvestris]|uniref:uncharacterized protein n=1 Tax=Nicotiana sylvestris TaxID=4096 RepID=UPI00388CB669
MKTNAVDEVLKDPSSYQRLVSFLRLCVIVFYKLYFSSSFNGDRRYWCYSNTGAEDIIADASPVADPSRVVEMVIDQQHPLFLQPSNTPSSPLISIKLTGHENYAMWRSSMCISLLGKSKLAFVDGRYIKHKFSPALHDLWEKCNAIVLSWIMNFISNEELSGMVYATSVQKVWDDLRESFNKGISSVSIYFAKLKNFGKSLMHLCLALDVVVRNRRDMQNILVIAGEESRRSVANFAQTSIANEGIAMFSGKGNTQGTSNYKPKRNNLFCDYCKYKGHTRDTCYKLHGYPAEFKQKRKDGPNNATQYTCPLTNSSPSSGNFEVAANLAGLQQSNLDSTSQGGQGVIAGVSQFTVDQYNQILHLLGKSNITSSSQSDPPSSVMSVGMTPSFVDTEAEVRWIVDTGASNRMVKSLKILEEPRSTDETSIGKDLFNGRVGGGKEDEGLYIYISGNKDQTNGGGNNNSDSERSFVNTIKDDSSSVSLWGPYRVPTHDGKKYFLTLVDDHSKFTWVFLLPSKAEVIVAIRQFFTMIKNVYSCTVKFLRTDNGCEFFNSQMIELLQSLGIVHQSSYVYTPQQNGGRTPFELLIGHQPSLDYIIVFGCLGYVTDVKKRDKFSLRASPSVFLGYSMTQKGYRMYNIHIKEFLVSRDVMFKENISPFQHSALLLSLFPTIDIPQVLLPNDVSISSSSPSSVSSSPPTHSSLPYPISTSPAKHSLEQPTQVPVEPEPVSPINFTLDQPNPQSSTSNDQLIGVSHPRRSGRTSKPPIWLKDYVTLSQGKANCSYPLSACVSYENISDSYAKAISSYSAVVEPQSYTEAVKHPKWIEAMKAEISALEENHIWSVVELPTGKVPIGCKWVFKVKYTSSGEVERYKARLVAKGYSQKEGLDYTESFSPIAMVTVRSVIAVAAAKQWPIFQMDVHNAFLLELLEEVYMDVPQGFASHGGSHKVCKLHRSLYGLKQAPRQWTRKLTDALV